MVEHRAGLELEHRRVRRAGAHDLDERLEVDPRAPADDERLGERRAVDALTELEITLTAWPWPTSPQWTISLPIASSSGIARCMSSSLPPAMIVSVPSSAFGAEPVTGASTRPWPCSRSVAPSRRASAGAIVEQSMNSVPSGAPATAPSSPSSIASTCAPSTTIVITASAPSAAARGLSATSALCSDAHASAVSRVRLKTRSSWPARTRFAAWREPMMPRPMKPTRIARQVSQAATRVPDGSATAALDELAVGQVLVRRAVAVVRQRDALARRALARRRPALEPVAREVVAVRRLRLEPLARERHVAVDDAVHAVLRGHREVDADLAKQRLAKAWRSSGGPSPGGRPPPHTRGGRARDWTRPRRRRGPPGSPVPAPGRSSDSVGTCVLLPPLGPPSWRAPQSGRLRSRLFS